MVGREQDLRFLATGLHGPWRVTEEAGKFYLRSGRFEKLGDAVEIKRVADEFVDWADLIALARSEGYQGVHTAEIVGLDPNGSRTVSFSEIIPTGEVVIVGFAPSVGEPRPPEMTPDTSLLKGRPLLAKALRHLRKEPNWYGYWKATEALGEEIGGLNNLVSRGWATEDERKRFEKTVHHHRHHRKPAPKNPMSEGEVRSRLLGCLRRCLDWRLSKRQ